VTEKRILNLSEVPYLDQTSVVISNSIICLWH